MCGKRLPELLPYRRSVSFCLTPETISELTVALASGQIAMDEWCKAVPVLTQLVDATDPVIVHAAGPYSPAPPPGGVSARDYYWGVWRLMTEHLPVAKDVARLRSGLVLNTPTGRHRVWNDPEVNQGHLESGRGYWGRYIANVASKDEMKDMREAQIVDALNRHLTAKYPAVDVSNYDAMHRVVAAFLKLRTRSHTPYNPASDDRAGDFPDVRMLSYLGRAALCTLDEKLIRTVMQTRSPQAGSVFGLDALITHLRQSGFCCA